MQDLTPQARLESEWGIEMADSLNQELGQEADHVFVYVVYDKVYLCKWEDEGRWRIEGEFEDTETGDVHTATDKVANEVDNFVLIDLPGRSENRLIATEP